MPVGVFSYLLWGSVCDGCSGHATQPQNLEPLENGVYAVLKEGAARTEVEEDNAHCVVLAYDRKYTDANADEPVRYIAIDHFLFCALDFGG